jgi:hypothetical protein
VTSVQAQTETGPPGPPGDDSPGIDLRRVHRITTYLTAPGGQTFTGTGFLRAWVYDKIRGLWTRAPRSDEDLVDATGLEAATFGSMAVGSERTRFAWLLDGVGLSGAGGNVTIDLCATTPAGDPV